MLRFFSSVKAIYIYHNHTNQFLGVAKNRSSTGQQLISPVSDVSEALNFRFSNGGENSDINYNPSSLQDVKIVPKTYFLRVEHPTQKLSWDAETGADRDGNNIIFYNSHNGNPQKFQINFLPDLSFIFRWNERCVIYEEKGNLLKTGSCSDFSKSKFQFFLNTTPEKKEEPKTCPVCPSPALTEFNSPEFESPDVIDYSTGSKLLRPSRNPFVKTTIRFDNGKAIKTHVLGQSDDIKVGHGIINVDKYNDSIDLIGKDYYSDRRNKRNSRNPRNEEESCSKDDDYFEKQSYADLDDRSFDNYRHGVSGRKRTPLRYI